MFARLTLSLASILFLFAARSPAVAAEGDARFAVSPESAFGLLESTIREAKESIELNIYMLTNRNITQLLADKAQQGVYVTVLLEGETFGGEMLAPVKDTLEDLYLRFDQQSQGRGKFLVMTSQGGKAQRRFAFNHAKYLIVDGRKAFVSSENITGSAFNNKNLSGGTRGWEIMVESKALAGALSKVFRTDSDLRQPDVVPYEKANFKVKDPGNSALPPRKPRTVPLFPVTGGKVKKVAACASPKSLNCILDFIRDAKTDLAVEHLSLPMVWVDHATGRRQANPIVEEIVKAAKRGVKVRVLLNDDKAFADTDGGSDEDKNLPTVKYLQDQAKKNQWSLEAATFNQAALQVNYVHNKGMVADGDSVFVGSINGTQNSVENNREIALLVQSKDAARYYGNVFDLDWSQRVSVP